LLAVGVSPSRLNILGFLDKIFLEIMQHIQNVEIFLMASKPPTALNKIG
jgi:hypothetical protein